MLLEFINLGGYGQFVWPAFIFASASCFILYLKTKKEFIKQEKLYLKEFKQEKDMIIKDTKRKEAFSGIIAS